MSPPVIALHPARDVNQWLREVADRFGPGDLRGAMVVLLKTGEDQPVETLWSGSIDRATAVFMAECLRHNIWEDPDAHPVDVEGAGA